MIEGDRPVVFVEHVQAGGSWKTSTPKRIRRLITRNFTAVETVNYPDDKERLREHTTLTIVVHNAFVSGEKHRKPLKFDPSDVNFDELVNAYHAFSFEKIPETESTE